MQEIKNWPDRWFSFFIEGLGGNFCLWRRVKLVRGRPELRAYRGTVACTSLADSRSAFCPLCLVQAAGGSWDYFQRWQSGPSGGWKGKGGGQLLLPCLLASEPASHQFYIILRSIGESTQRFALPKAPAHVMSLLVLCHHKDERLLFLMEVRLMVAAKFKLNGKAWAEACGAHGFLLPFQNTTKGRHR